MLAVCYERSRCDMYCGNWFWKTMGFALPCMTRLFKDKKSKRTKKPRALVLAPTRELACQIEKTYGECSTKVGCRHVCVFGGVPKYGQLQAIRNGLDVIIATPGRLLAYVREGEVDLSQVEYVVLDEADRMLEQGFIPDVRALIRETKNKGTRQTLLFSATWPDEVAEFAQEFLQSPVKITVMKQSGDSSETLLGMSQTVTQSVEVVKDWERNDKLYELLDQHRNKKIIVFGLYKKEVERLHWAVQDWGFNCVSVQGNKRQAERTEALNKFRRNASKILLATDVASRGLDIPDVDIVINYSFR
eukprot:UN33329